MDTVRCPGLPHAKNEQGFEVGSNEKEAKWTLVSLDVDIDDLNSRGKEEAFQTERRDLAGNERADQPDLL